MKKTTIILRAFDCESEITVLAKDFLCIGCAKEYVQKEIVPTAIVIGVIHHQEDKIKKIINQNYQQLSYL